MQRLVHDSGRARSPVDQSHRYHPPVQRTTRSEGEYVGDQTSLHQKLQGMKEAIANVQAMIDETMVPVMSIPTRHVGQRRTTARSRSPRPMDDDAPAAALPTSSRTMHATGIRATAPKFTGDTSDMGDTAATAMLNRRPVQRTADAAAALRVGQRRTTARSRSPRPADVATAALRVGQRRTTARSRSPRPADAPAAALRVGQRTADVTAAMPTRRPGQRTPAKPLRTSDKYQIVDPQVIVADGNIFNKFSLDKPDIKFMRVIRG